MGGSRRAGGHSCTIHSLLGSPSLLLDVLPEDQESQCNEDENALLGDFAHVSSFDGRTSCRNQWITRVIPLIQPLEEPEQGGKRGMTNAPAYQSALKGAKYTTFYRKSMVKNFEFFGD